jgi:hypothetical protein
MKDLANNFKHLVNLLGAAGFQREQQKFFRARHKKGEISLGMQVYGIIYRDSHSAFLS